MAFGPVTIAALDSEDVVAPGAPMLTVKQVSNRKGEYLLTPPETDADGEPLSGLTFSQVVVIQADETVAEQYRENFEGALALEGAQVFTADVVEGDPVAQSFDITKVGLPYSVLARMADHPNPLE